MKSIRWFQDIQATDVELVSGKGANLGEMSRSGLSAPPRFCLTAEVCRDFVRSAGPGQTILEIFDHVSRGNQDIRFCHGADPYPDYNPTHARKHGV